MRLQSAIHLLAGGPGSGCKGQNCGRPRIRIRTGKPKNLEDLKHEQKLMQRDAYWTRGVNKKLLEVGGYVVDHRTSGAELEGYLHEYLKKNGYLHSIDGLHFAKGKAHDCHDNVCTLVKKDPTVQTATGYGLDKKEGVWYRHSWGVDKDNKIVETTPGQPMAAYFGIIQDQKYNDWLQKKEDSE